MAIPLGRSWTDPSFMMWQIVATTALYFAILGLVAYIVSIGGYLLFSPSPDSHTTTTLASRLWAHCSRMTIQMLFSHEEWVSSPSTGAGRRGEAITTIGSDVRFLTLHVLTAVLAGVAIGYVIHRRRFVLDFTCTVYAAYVLVAWVVLGAFPCALWWWLCTCAGAIVMWIVMTYVCRFQEMQDIELMPMVVVGGGGARGGGGVDTSPTIGGAIVTPVAAAAGGGGAAAPTIGLVAATYRHARESSQTTFSVAESKKE